MLKASFVGGVRLGLTLPASQLKEYQMPEPNRTVKFFKENQEKFKTRRQASKYLNHYGMVWKTEHNIPLTDPRRS